MKKIKVLMSGFGKMGSIMSWLLQDWPDIELVPYVLEKEAGDLRSTEFRGWPSGAYLEFVQNSRLIPENEHREFLSDFRKNENGVDVIVDFSQPAVANRNAQVFSEVGVPFVMGTTGGDKEEIEKIVADSDIPAVLAPNMAKQIVGFQAGMQMLAKNFPGIFQKWTLRIVESHQKSKADTSGTAKAMVEYFSEMGARNENGKEFQTEDILKVRDEQTQSLWLDVPREYLDSHGYHTYIITSPDGKVEFRFTHNVNGREIYGDGLYSAINFVLGGTPGILYSMIDVLKAGY